jgi:hypothetical protein
MRYEIVKASVLNDQQGKEFLNVEYKVYDNDEEVFHGNEGFSAGTTSEEVKFLLDRKLEAIHSDAAHQALIAEQDVAREELRKTAAELNGEGKE